MNTNEQKPVDVLAVLERAAGDATGNPIESGQAYAAIEAFKALTEAVGDILRVCPEGGDWRMTSGNRGFVVSVDEIDDLRAALARVGAA